MDPTLAAAIKVELSEFVTAAGTRRDLPTTCHVGHPGGERSTFEHLEIDDASLRADLVERAIDGLLTTDGACAWVTRGGDCASLMRTRSGSPLPGRRSPGTGCHCRRSSC